MPVRDRYYETVRNALIKDGWTITHDPLRLTWSGTDLYVDLGAERLLAAERGEQRIAVEIKSFLGVSRMTDLERALGQFVLYQALLTQLYPGRVLHLAVPRDIFRNLFEERFELLVQNGLVRVISFDPLKEELLKWIP